MSDPLSRNRVRDTHGVVHICCGAAASRVGQVLCGYHERHAGERVEHFARSGQVLDGVPCPLCLDVLGSGPPTSPPS